VPTEVGGLQVRVVATDDLRRRVPHRSPSRMPPGLAPNGPPPKATQAASSGAGRDGAPKLRAAERQQGPPAWRSGGGTSSPGWTQSERTCARLKKKREDRDWCSVQRGSQDDHRRREQAEVEAR
jgi:hypothetical protein